MKNVSTRQRGLKVERVLTVHKARSRKLPAKVHSKVFVRSERLEHVNVLPRLRQRLPGNYTQRCHVMVRNVARKVKISARGWQRTRGRPRRFARPHQKTKSNRPQHVCSPRTYRVVCTYIYIDPQENSRLQKRQQYSSSS